MLGRRQSNILVIKTDNLAAFVAAEPAFEAIRQAHPESKISLLTAAALQRIARASPYFDQVAAVPNFRDATARKEFVKQIKMTKFERVYDLAGSEDGRRLYSAMGMFRPKWFTASSVGKARRKKKTPGDFPQIEQMLTNAGVEMPVRLPGFNWAIAARKDSANMKPSWYGISAPFGLILPGANSQMRWHAAGYAQLASLMAENGYMAVLAGAKELHHFGDEIAQDAPQLVDLTGKTDHLQLAALAQDAAFFVSDDAEEMHLAVSVGCRGVLICDAARASGAPQGRHVVSITSPDGPATIDPSFIWRTLSNMGLVVNQDMSAFADAR